MKISKQPSPLAPASDLSSPLAPSLASPILASPLPPDQFQKTTATSPALSTIAFSGERPSLKAQRFEKYFSTTDYETIISQARQQLGIDTAQLPTPEERKHQFEAFAARFFPQPPEEADPFELTYYGPTSDMPLYQQLETYAMTDYGALMLKKVLNEAGDKPFAIKVIPGQAPQSWNDFISFPAEFGSKPGKFKISQQPIDYLAIIHHEFEHTRFGRFLNDDQNVLLDELHAVKEIENPVRVLNGFEPRYTYTQMDSMGEAIQTMSMIQPDIVKPGAWTFAPTDPSKLIPLD